MIRRLHPWSGNLTKRLVKTPRFYWRDSGPLRAILNGQIIEHLYDQPLVGCSWEGFVIEQILTSLGLSGSNAEPYFSEHPMASNPTSSLIGAGNAGPSRSNSPQIRPKSCSGDFKKLLNSSLPPIRLSYAKWSRKSARTACWSQTCHLS